MKTAEQIKQEMRDTVAEHNGRVAQRTAQAALDELTVLIRNHQLNYAIASHFSRELAEGLLSQLEPYLTLLAEVAPTLPTQEQVDAPYKKIAQGGEEQAA